MITRDAPTIQFPRPASTELIAIAAADYDALCRDYAAAERVRFLLNEFHNNWQAYRLGEVLDLIDTISHTIRKPEPDLTTARPS